jgi:ferredoxin
MRVSTTGKAQFQSSVEKMLNEGPVYGPKRKMPAYVFDRLFSVDELCLDYDIALLPPNKYFLPPRTTLLRFKLPPEASTESTVDTQSSIIGGIHPYDLHALKLLDAVFLGDLTDTNYQAKRKATAIIGMDCLKPRPYSFAASMGTALPPNIFDLWLTDLGDEYLIEVGSDKGERLCRRYLSVTEANQAKVAQREKLRQESLRRYRLSLDVTPTEIPKVLDTAWDNPLWEELGQNCFSCGSCTMVCPTCICFDVRDKNDLSQLSGERYRTWDSCMFDGFAKVASGENFRPTGIDRLRHRLYRKGKYMLERWGELGCVGCGRCVHACLVDIASPVYAYNRLINGKRA